MTVNRDAMDDGAQYAIVNLSKIRHDCDSIERSQRRLRSEAAFAPGDAQDRWYQGVLDAYNFVLSDAVIVEEL